MEKTYAPLSGKGKFDNDLLSCVISIINRLVVTDAGKAFVIDEISSDFITDCIKSRFISPCKT